jgi:hypothetical protein
MSITSVIQRIQKDIADLQKKMSNEKKRESDAVTKANRLSGSITKSTSAQTAKSKLSQIASANDEAATASGKQADLQKKLAAKTKALHRYEQQLMKEQGAQRKKVEDSLKQRDRQLAETQQALTEELENQKRMISVHSTQTVMDSDADKEPKYDVFISHASEDKEDIVRPLAEELVNLGVRVWYDEFSLKWGDSLRRSIDKGLARSRFGVVVISSSFIAKQWPQYEVDGLVAREMAEGGKVILPIWHKVTRSDVLKYSPTLADKLALNTSLDEIPTIAKQLKEML